MALGQTQVHIDAEMQIHRELINPWQYLYRCALDHGFQLKIASGFRSFERQLAIWNAKCLGMRPILDEHSQPISIQSLSAKDKVLAILRWSALPGASRHHWGTDIDVFDAAAVGPDYKLELVDQEYTGQGPFASMTQWLDEWIASDDNPGFVKPYAKDSGGVHPEAWHLSYLPLAKQYESALNEHSLRSCLSHSSLEDKATVLMHLPYIYKRFINLG